MIQLYTVCTEQYIHTVLSTLLVRLLPLLHGLFRDDPGCVERSIEADVFADGRFETWFLQDSLERNWRTDEDDRLDLDTWRFVGQVQFYSVLASEVRTSSFQVLAEVGLCMGSDMSYFMVTPEFSFFQADLFLDQHDVSLLEREPNCAPPHIFSHDEMGS